jgi:CRISPR-associated endonuclease Cas1 subtype II
MAFRTVIINTHSKIEYSLNYLVFRTVEQTKRILLDEIHTVIFESTDISVTICLLCELINRKIKIIFCNEKHNPISELIPYNGSCYSSKRIFEQISWTYQKKNTAWKMIIEFKIDTECYVLDKLKKYDSAKQLEKYILEVLEGDTTNREGHAAKVYFSKVFYQGFTRENNDTYNSSLDYGYTILLSQFNRIISASGYLTQLGIHHIGELNPYNFGCDLMEPFRYIVDIITIELIEKKSPNFKGELIKMLDKKVVINGKKETVVNAIKVYFLSVIRFLNGKSNKILFLDKYGIE